MEGYNVKELQDTLGHLSLDFTPDSNGYVPSLSAKEVRLRHIKHLSPWAKENIKPKAKPQGQRSEKIFALACTLFESNLSVDEVFVLIRNSGWNKYKGRSDEVERLWEVVHRAQHRTRDNTTPVDEDDPDASEDDALDDARTFVVEDGDYFVRQDHGDPSWMVEGVWSEQSHGFIGGEPKSYKSWIAIDMALSVASGMPFMGRFDVHEQGPAMIVQEEISRKQMHYRLTNMAEGKGLAGDVTLRRGVLKGVLPGKYPPIQMINQQGMNLTSDEDVEWLADYAVKMKAKMIVLDPLALMLGDKNENDNSEMRGVLNRLLQLRIATDAAVVVVHHNTKSDDEGGRQGGKLLRGAGAFWGWLESGMYVKRTSDYGATINREFRNFHPHAPLEFELDVDPQMGYYVKVNEREAKHTAEKMSPLARFVDKFPNSTMKDAANYLKVDRTTVIRQLEKDRHVVTFDGKPKGKGGRPPKLLKIKPREA